MSGSSEAKQCPGCGAPIPSEAPHGLCPRCLLLQASFPTDAGQRAPAGEPRPTPEELARAFPQLEILELIGQGGMGFVFKVRQPKLDRFVALKILPQTLAADAEFAERFTQEGRLLARLNHPNIVTVHDFGQANGFFYLLMEYVEGVNLRQAMGAGRFSPEQALAIVPKICEALQFAHSEGVLHRDIKPENILLDTRGRVKIADFGIAKLVGAERLRASRGLTDSGAGGGGQGTGSEGELTEAGKVLGTPHYMAPEQLDHPQQVDHRADIYSLGVVFYEMLTGELPAGRFVPPSEKSKVDPRVDELVLRALQKAPESRPQTVAEFKTQLETIALGGDAKAPKTGFGRAAAQARPDRSRRRLGVAGAIGLALILVLGLIWLALRKPKAGAVGKELVLTRATNFAIGSLKDTWALSIWTDTPLQPGEELLAEAKRGQGAIGQSGCSSLFFTHWEPRKTSTSVSLTWYFGAAWSKEFGEVEAQAAVRQLQDRMSERLLKLTVGKPFELFSITNSFGHIMKGYAAFSRSVPARALSKSAAKPEAIVEVRRFAAFLPSLDYSVKLPPGYALMATANMGNVATHFSQPASPADYHSAWFRVPSFGRPASPNDYRDYPAQLEAQRRILEARFEELRKLGPITVALDEPYEVFSVTNKAGEVYSGFLNLVGPTSMSSNANETASIQLENPGLIGSSREHSGDVASSPDWTGSTLPLRQKLPTPPAIITPGTIDPTTGLPVGSSGSIGPEIDPATGLPTVPAGLSGGGGIDPATGLPRMSGLPATPKRIPNLRTNRAGTTHLTD